MMEHFGSAPNKLVEGVSENSLENTYGLVTYLAKPDADHSRLVFGCNVLSEAAEAVVIKAGIHDGSEGRLSANYTELYKGTLSQYNAINICQYISKIGLDNGQQLFVSAMQDNNSLFSAVMENIVSDQDIFNAKYTTSYPILFAANLPNMSMSKVGLNDYQNSVALSLYKNGNLFGTIYIANYQMTATTDATVFNNGDIFTIHSPSACYDLTSLILTIPVSPAPLVITAGTPSSEQEFTSSMIGKQYFRTNCVGSLAQCSIAPTSDVVFGLYKNNEQEPFGTVTFYQGMISGVFNSTQEVIMLNESVLKVKSPVDVAAIAGVEFKFSTVLIRPPTAPIHVVAQYADRA